MKSTIHRLVGIAVLALSAGVSAQTPAPQAPKAPQAPGATFRVAIDYVTTDVIARNNQDQFVADLTKGDFEIYEDGVKQDITSLTLVHGARGAADRWPDPPGLAPAQRHRRPHLPDHRRRPAS